MRSCLPVLFSILCLGIWDAQAQELFKITGELRTRGEIRDNADFNSDRLDGTVVVFNRLRLGIRHELEHGLEFFAQLQDSRIWGEEGSSLASLSNIDLHQAYVEIDRPAALPLSVRLGRQEMFFGSERLVGRYDWNNVGRAFDALRLSSGGATQNLNLWIAQVRDYNAPLVARNQEFGGAFFSSQRILPVTLDSYFLILYDARNIESVANPAPPGVQTEPAKTLTIYTAGGRVSGKIQDRLDYDLEGAYQFGKRGFRDIRAHGLALDAGYTLAKRWSPTIHAGYTRGSGDDNPNDGTSEPFSNLFPEVHRYLGAIDYASWSNISAFNAGFTLAPREHLSLGLDWHLLELATDRDSWYRAGGFNIGTPQEFYRKAVPGAGRRLGQEIDFHTKCFYRERLEILLGMSYFGVGEFIKNTGGLRADDSIWSYLSVAIEF